jgi:hypothetical protein
MKKNKLKKSKQARARTLQGMRSLKEWLQVLGKDFDKKSESKKENK